MKLSTKKFGREEFLVELEFKFGFKLLNAFSRQIRRTSEGQAGLISDRKGAQNGIHGISTGRSWSEGQMRHKSVEKAQSITTY